MNSLPYDVYISYPELSRSLLNVSKQLSLLSLKGACDSFINDNEIINYILQYNYSKLGIIIIFDKYESHTHIFLNDTNIDEEWINYEENTLEITHLNSLRFTPKDICEYIKLKRHQNIYPDIITIYKIFSNRISCQKLPNYAKQLTKEYFNFVTKQLTTTSLYIYLISNNIILNHVDSLKLLPKKIELLIDNINLYIDNL